MSASVLSSLLQADQASAFERISNACDPEQLQALVCAWQSQQQQQLATLAQAAYQQQLYALAAELFQQMRQCNWPLSRQQWLHYGQCLQKLDQSQQQLTVLQSAVEHHPQSSPLWHALGNAYRAQGAWQASKDSYLAAAERNHRNPSLLYALAGMMPLHNLPASWTAYLHQELTQGKRPVEQRALAGFVLGQQALSIGDAHAMSYFQQANQLHLQKYPLRLQIDRQQRDILIREWSPSLLLKWQRDVEEVPQPQQIIIVGMSRSGKTLVEHLINLAPDTQAQRETLSIESWLRNRFDNKPIKRLAPWLQQLTPDQLQDWRHNYQRDVNPCGPARRSYTLPWNLKHLGHLSLLNPQAKIIFVGRDADDLALACYCKAYAQGNGYASDLATLGEQIAIYEQLSEHWQGCLPNPMMSLSYESLVQEPLRVLLKLIRFIGAKVDPQVLAKQLHTAEDIGSNLAQSQDQLTKIHANHVHSSRTHQAFLQPMRSGYERCWHSFRP